MSHILQNQNRGANSVCVWHKKAGKETVNITSSNMNSCRIQEYGTYY
jgi:hypothetical protein